MNTINWIDVVIFFSLLISGITGVIRGFFKEVLFLLVWGGAIVCAWLLSVPAGGIIKELLGDKSADLSLKFGDPKYYNGFLSIIGGFLVLLGCVIVFQIIASLFTYTFRSKTLSSADRLLGLAVGIVKALVMLAILWFFANNVMGVTKPKVDTQHPSSIYLQAKSSKLLLPVKITSVLISPLLNHFVTKTVNNLTTDNMDGNNKDNTNNQNGMSNDNNHTDIPVIKDPSSQTEDTAVINQ